MANDTRTYRICVMDPSNGSESFREYTATALGEALTMAEREDAGKATMFYGVCPDDYAQAIEEGIQFNEADGLVMG